MTGDSMPSLRTNIGHKFENSTNLTFLILKKIKSVLGRPYSGTKTLYHVYNVRVTYRTLCPEGSTIGGI